MKEKTSDRNDLWSTALNVAPKTKKVLNTAPSAEEAWRFHKREAWKDVRRSGGEEFGRRAEEWGERFERRAEEECFGLPHGGAIAGLFIGIIIILVGLSWLTGFEWEHFWPVVAIIFGILIVVGAIYGLSRR